VDRKNRGGLWIRVQKNTSLGGGGQCRSLGRTNWVMMKKHVGHGEKKSGRSVGKGKTAGDYGVSTKAPELFRLGVGKREPKGRGKSKQAIGGGRVQFHEFELELRRQEPRI